MVVTPDSVLDSILATQLTIAWAGEGRCSPRRLGWWDTDLIDEAGGGDLLARLLPQTHAWASLEAAREAARRVDAKTRARLADPDLIRSLFFLGFELDEKLNDRLAALKRSGQPPGEALSPAGTLNGSFSKERLAAILGQGDSVFSIVPGGRQLEGAPPDAPDVAIRRLAAALVPLIDHYPLPFYRLGT